jgi:hypothetical protein
MGNERTSSPFRNPFNSASKGLFRQESKTNVANKSIDYSRFYRCIIPRKEF